jgi:5-methylcytosine-specific restriction endonuclease McrA
VLLSHAVPSGDVAEVFDRALRALVPQLERRKFAASTGRRRPAPRTSTRPRHIPTLVKHAVWQRDGGRCTFVSETGQRCPARTMLEYDHVDPIARGGRATVAGLRLLCRAHNQYEAERVFGAGFMQGKREDARRAAAEAQTRAAAAAPAEDAANARAQATTEAQAQATAAAHALATAAEAEAVTRQHTADVLSGLRGLGVRAADARRAAEYSGTLGDVTLEERMRAALQFLYPKGRTRGTHL